MPRSAQQQRNKQVISTSVRLTRQSLAVHRLSVSSIVACVFPLLLLPARATGLLPLPHVRKRPRHHQLQRLAFASGHANLRLSSRGLRMTNPAASSCSSTSGSKLVSDATTAPSVAVIGAGGAGLSAGRILHEEGCRVTIFDKSDEVGGVWRYRPEPEAHAPMYRSLVTNLPKEIMSFFGYPFPEELPSFITHAQVLDYLRAYTSHYNLGSLIKHGCRVESVRPLPLSGDGTSSTSPTTQRVANIDVVANLANRQVPQGSVSVQDVGGVVGWRGLRDDGQGGNTSWKSENDALGKWMVVYSQNPLGSSSSGSNGDSNRDTIGLRPSSRSGEDAKSLEGGAAYSPSIKTEIFDAVCVCNGHYEEPFTPATEGSDSFRGISLHSRAYDTPDVKEFVGKRVLCVGSRSSGTDVAREVSSVASVVHVCDRSVAATLEGGGDLGNVCWRPALMRFEGSNGVRFKDGTSAEIDTVVWCTGYSYSFPFLESSGLLTPPVTERVHPLYEQVFHVQHPSLSFVGLPQSIVPFPLFDLQANAVAAAISGRGPLPGRADRERWLLEEERKGMEERSVDPASRGAHVMGGRQWPYSKRLLQLARGPGSILTSRVREPAAKVTSKKHCKFGMSSGDARESDSTLPKISGSSSSTSIVSDASDSASVVDVEVTMESEAAGHSNDRDHIPLDNHLPAASTCEDTKILLKELEIREAIYNDTGCNRPHFPGGPDDYRRRLYCVDPKTGNFSVSMADRKANGEGPSFSSSRAADIFTSSGNAKG